jgi:hypothetical protein
MGGLGSGRRPGFGRDTVEGSRVLDGIRLHRAGCLREGYSGGWQWTRDGEAVASIGMRCDGRALHLSYRLRSNGGAWEDVSEGIAIRRVACRFGGARLYLICPGIVSGIRCDRRVLKLYGAGRYFLCRHCWRLRHASQSEGPLDRSIRRAEKLRRRLGAERCEESAPPRPKGMWRRTHDRLCRRLMEAQFEADEGFYASATALLARLDRKKRRK